MFARTIRTTLAYCGAAALITMAFSATAFAGSDETLADSVREALGPVYGERIDVQAEGDRVYLSGQVGTEEARASVIDRASHVPGVRIVQENIENIGGMNG